METNIKQLIPNPNNKAVYLLNQFRNGKMSYKDLNAECAYWYLTCIENTKPKTVGAEPLGYSELKNIWTSGIAKTKKVLASESLCLNNPKLLAYKSELGSAIRYNRATLATLRRFKKMIPSEDIQAHKQYEDKIFSFSISLRFYEWEQSGVKKQGEK